MRKANDPNLKTWVPVAEESDFPIQNLPFGIFQKKGKSPRIGVAIGKQILDLSQISKIGLFDDCGVKGKNVFKNRFLNRFLSFGKSATGKIRDRVSEILSEDNSVLRDNEKRRKKALVPMDEVEMLLPVNIKDYTDFYSSIEHATNVGSIFRDPKNALLPNWRHIPVGYHGRSGSIVVSGTPVMRPRGQFKSPGSDFPSFGLSGRLDFELEMAFITCGKTNPGDTISVANAENYIFGFTLFNDWSARDIQAWEYVPLGPFLGKNFASSMSPWVITLDALEPYRTKGPIQDPPVLPYLEFEGKRNFDIDLEVSILPDSGEENIICRTNYKYMYWNVAQQLAHHTVNGCNINIGDVCASGTISGKDPSSFGSMLELTWNGTKPLQLNDGSQRSFLNDGDTIIMRGFTSKNGTRIGFGEVRSKVLRANDSIFLNKE